MTKSKVELQFVLRKEVYTVKGRKIEAYIGRLNVSKSNLFFTKFTL